jgi:hypothetical protein
MATKPQVPITTPGHPSEFVNFVVSARDLPMRDRGVLGATVHDPFVKVSTKNAANKEFTLIGKTGHRVNEANPDWFDHVFTFEWLQGSGQVWRIEVLDFDILPKDDPMGYLDVDVDTFMLGRNQQFIGKLSTGQGSVLIQRTQVTKFRLSARTLPKLDAFTGLSDPFVKCFWSFGKAGPKYYLFATTKTVKDVENADWDEVIEFKNYQPGQGQHLTFRVYDKDTLPSDDYIGEGVIDVDYFVKARAATILKLDSKNQATLIVTPA